MSSTDRMTIAAVANHLGVSRWTVSRLLEAAGIKSADRRGVRTSDLVDWLTRQTVSPNQKDGDMPTSPPQLPPMFAFEVVADQYGLSLRSLQEGARRKKFSHTAIGQARFFTEAQLAAFLAARAVESTRETSLDGMRTRRARRAQRRAAAA